MEILKLLSANEIVAQIVTFLILLLLMKRFVWKPFLGILDGRRERIASELKKIDEAKAAAEAFRADYASRLNAIESEARSRIAAAADEGRKAAEEIRQNARDEGDKILAKAQENIKSEIAKAEEALKDRIVNLTVDIAGKVIQERLTVEDDKAIVETFIKEIGRE